MHIKKSNLRELTIVIAAVAIALMAACNDSTTSSKSDSNSNSGDNSLLGAGSTFVYPLFSKLFSEYNKATGLKVNYQSIGSGGGILQLTNKTVDFGESDAPLNDDQTQKNGCCRITYTYVFWR